MGDISIIDLDDANVIGLKRTGRYHEISEMIPALFQHVFGNGMEVAGPPIFICHEKTEEEAVKAAEEGNAQLEAALPVMGKVVEKDDIRHYQLPGGRFVKISHMGPYDKVGEAYTKLFTWLNNENRRIIGPIREYYLNDPREVAPEEILTDIYAPIE